MANPLTVITSLGGGKSRLSNEGVVKRDWVPTGRIDFATKLNGNGDGYAGYRRALRFGSKGHRLKV